MVRRCAFLKKSTHEVRKDRSHCYRFGEATYCQHEQLLGGQLCCSFFLDHCAAEGEPRMRMEDLALETLSMGRNGKGR